MQKIIDKKIQKMRVKKGQRFFSIMPVCVASIMLGALLLGANPIATDGARAESEVTFAIQDEESLTMNLSSDAVVLSVQPGQDGVFGRPSRGVTVSTNVAYGYTLTMIANTDTLTRSAAVNGVTPTIGPLTSSVTCAVTVDQVTTPETDTTCLGWTIDNNNMWGYRVNDGASYMAVPTTATVIDSTDAAADSNTTTIYFGAKLDNDIPVGSYQGVTLTFSATANEAVAASLQDAELETTNGQSVVEPATDEEITEVEATNATTEIEAAVMSDEMVDTNVLLTDTANEDSLDRR